MSWRVGWLWCVAVVLYSGVVARLLMDPMSPFRKRSKQVRKLEWRMLLITEWVPIDYVQAGGLEARK